MNPRTVSHLALALSLVAGLALPVARAAVTDTVGQRNGCGPEGTRRCIAFTFDDGPDCHTTPRLLSMLDARNLRATFFVVGHRLDGDDAYHTANREVLRELRRRGHTVGNHSYHHVLLDGLTPAHLAFEIDRTEALIEQTLHEHPTLLRAPFGAIGTRRTAEAIFARGYTPVSWTLDTADWSVHSADAVAVNFRAALNAHPRGGVVLMHDTHAWSVAAFPMVFAELERRNQRLRASGQAPYEVVGLGAFYGRSASSETAGQETGEAHAARR